MRNLHAYIFFLLCSLLVGHHFDLDITKVIVLRAEKRLELPSPFWHSSVLPQVGLDPLNFTVWVSPNLSLGFLYLWRSVAGRLGHRGWRRRGPRSISSLCRFYKLGNFMAFQRRTWDLWWYNFLAQEDGFLLWCEGGLTFLFCGAQEGGLQDVILLRVIKGAMHFWSSHAKLHRALISISHLSVQVCSVQAKTRFFSCITVWKSLVPEALLWGMKSQGHSLLRQGGASHEPEASYLARGSLNATTCHQALCRASGSQGSSLMMWLPMDTLLLTLISFQKMRVFGPLHLYMDPPAEGAYRIQSLFWPWMEFGLGLTSGWFGWAFRLDPSYIGRAVLWALTRGSHGESMDTGVEG